MSVEPIKGDKQLNKSRDYLLYILCVASCCMSMMLAAICHLSLPLQRPLRIAIIAERLNSSNNLDFYSANRHASYIPYNPKLIELSTSILNNLENAENYHKISNVWSLPRPIFELCTGGEGMMANPGQSWEATDMVSDFLGSLPSRRLIWAASIAKGKYYLVHYEVGGFARYSNFILAELNGDKARLLWYGYGGTVWNFDIFILELKSNKFNKHKAFNGLQVDNGSISKFSFR